MLVDPALYKSRAIDWDRATRPACQNCQIRPCKRKKSAKGLIYYNKLCQSCVVIRQRYITLAGTRLPLQERLRRKELGFSSKRYGYRLKVQGVCEKCGFKPSHIAQMDVHHKDRNHNNNDPSNLMTLCANCHRLEHTKVAHSGVA